MDWACDGREICCKGGAERCMRMLVIRRRAVMSHAGWCIEDIIDEMNSMPQNLGCTMLGGDSSFRAITHAPVYASRSERHTSRRAGPGICSAVIHMHTECQHM